MALENPYCTVAEVQGELRNTAVELVPTIEAAINSASRYIDDYKGRDYFFHDHSSTPLVLRLGSGSILQAFLYLPHWPIVTLTQVEVNDDVWTEEEHFVKQETRLISLSGCWPIKCYSDKIELTGTFGYVQALTTDVPTGLPANINRAAVLIAAAFTGHNSKEVIGLDGAKTAVIDKAIPKVAFSILGGRHVLV